MDFLSVTSPILSQPDHQPSTISSILPPLSLSSAPSSSNTHPPSRSIRRRRRSPPPEASATSLEPDQPARFEPPSNDSESCDPARASKRQRRRCSLTMGDAPDGPHDTPPTSDVPGSSHDLLPPMAIPTRNKIHLDPPSPKGLAGKLSLLGPPLVTTF